MHLEEIKRHLADRIIKSNHYSGTVAFGTQVCLGVFEGDELLGVLQLGKGVYPIMTIKHVKDTEMNQYMELNRMWLSDKLPHNSESKAIGLMFKWMRKNRPEIKWLISFADGIEGNCGTIYQATNWIYTGYNQSGGLWVTQEGKKMHVHSASKGLPNQKRETLETKWGPLLRVSGGQFRYIYFLDKKWRKRLRLDSYDYPKASNLRDYLTIHDGGPKRPELFDELQGILKRPADSGLF